MKTTEKTKIETQKNRNLEGKLAIITGASRGLGREMAIDLASRGANIIVTYSNSKAAAESLVEEIEAMQEKASAIKLTLGKTEEINDFSKALEQELKFFGKEKIDILVNNAGIAGSSTVDTMTEGDFDELINVNLKSVFFMIRELEKHMKEGGSIINLSSSLTRHSYNFDDYMVYSATKAALNVLTRDFAVKFGPRKIRVNAVAPGVTYTDMTSGFLDQMNDHFSQITALKRTGKPNDISPVVAFLASEDSKWITGEVLEVSGGALI